MANQILSYHHMDSSNQVDSSLVVKAASNMDSSRVDSNKVVSNMGSNKVVNNLTVSLHHHSRLVKGRANTISRMEALNKTSSPSAVHLKVRPVGQTEMIFLLHHLMPVVAMDHRKVIEEDMDRAVRQTLVHKVDVEETMVATKVDVVETMVAIKVDVVETLVATKEDVVGILVVIKVDVVVETLVAAKVEEVVSNKGEVVEEVDMMMNPEVVEAVAVAIAVVAVVVVVEVHLAVPEEGASAEDLVALEVVVAIPTSQVILFLYLVSQFLLLKRIFRTFLAKLV